MPTLEEKVDRILESVYAIDTRTKLIDQKAELKLQVLEEKLDDVRALTDVNTRAITVHVAEDTLKFAELDAQRRVTKAKLGVLALLGGGSALGLKEVWAKLVRVFIDG